MPRCYSEPEALAHDLLVAAQDPIDRARNLLATRDNDFMQKDGVTMLAQRCADDPRAATDVSPAQVRSVARPRQGQGQRSAGRGRGHGRGPRR